MRREGNEWIVGSSSVERRFRLVGGRFYLVSLRSKLSGREYQDAANPPAEIRFLANGQYVSASGWRWKLGGDSVTRGNHGELQLDIALESEGLRVTKHYVIYPGTP